VLDGELGSLLSRVQGDPDQRRGEFVVVLAGAVDDAEARLASGRRLYARLVREGGGGGAAKLAAELSGAPRQALYAAGE
jgi:16S rRNA (cytidine1402-2'-O)-methyltransferase